MNDANPKAANSSEMSGLEAAFSVQKKRRRGPKCGMGTLLDDLDDRDQKALLNVLDSRWTGEEIAEQLREAGYQMKGHTVQRHRRGECSC